MVFGEILFERDVLEEATRLPGARLSGSIQSMWYIGSLQWHDLPGSPAPGHGGYFRRAGIVEEIAHMALRSDASQWDNALASALAIRLAVQRDDLATAEQWWKKGGFPDLNTPIALENYPYHIFEYVLLAQARFLLVKGQETGRARDLKQAAEWLGTLLPEAERFQRVASQIQILVLQAMAQSALGMNGRQRPCCVPWRWASRKAFGGFTWMKAGGWPTSCASAGPHKKNLAAISLPWLYRQLAGRHSGASKNARSIKQPVEAVEQPNDRPPGRWLAHLPLSTRDGSAGI